MLYPSPAGAFGLHPTWSASSFCNRPSALRRRLINAPKDVSVSIASSDPPRLLFSVLGSSIVLLLYVLCIARHPQPPADLVFHKQVEKNIKFQSVHLETNDNGMTWL